MPGRPPKPTAIHLLQGTAQKCRMDKRKGEMELDAVMPTPPMFLNAAALVEWGRVTSIAKYARCLTPADRMIVAMYCKLNAEFESSGSECLACKGAGDYSGGEYAKQCIACSGTGVFEMSNPRMELLMKSAAKLGMTPVDRVKVIVPEVEKPANKFSKLAG